MQVLQDTIGKILQLSKDTTIQVEKLHHYLEDQKKKESTL